MIKRTILILVCASALLISISPVQVMAARKGQGKRPEMQQLKKERQALRSEIQAARAKGAISPEDKAKFRAERQRLRKEASALGLNQNRKARSRNRGTGAATEKG